MDLDKLLEVLENHKRNFGVLPLSNSDLIWILKDYLELTSEE